MEKGLLYLDPTNGGRWKGPTVKALNRSRGVEAYKMLNFEATTGKPRKNKKPSANDISD